jgi:hypothetical protein
LEENLKQTQEIKEMTKYIKKYVVISQIFGVIKLALIIVPIVLGFIYLPPIFRDLMEQYRNFIQM